jgi:hypothetical protein
MIAIVPLMSRTLSRTLVVALSPLILAMSLSACGGEDTVDQKSSSASPEKSDAPETKKQAESVIVETGFGQAGEAVSLPALVENRTDHGGQTVTVSYNLKDKAGAVVKTETQVESFSYAGQMLALVGSSYLDSNEEIVSVDATLLVEEDGIGVETDLELGPVEAKSISKDEYGSVVAKFSIKNPTAKPLKDLRIGIICKDKAGRINGGTSEYPDLVPPSGEIAVDAALTVSGVPATCIAYPGPGL